MAKRKTTEQFIEEAKAIHGDRYDYSQVDYQSIKKHITIICPIHGEFSMTGDSHLNKKQGCSKCSGRYRYTTTEWIAKAREIHGDSYDYTLVEYQSTHSKIKIICPEHGIFEQSPAHHLSGRKCPKCSGKGLSNVEWIAMFRNTHGNKYAYDKMNYQTSTKKVIISCPTHGDFKQRPNDHRRGDGCPKCSKVYRRTTNDFINESNEVHNCKYDYSKSVYTGVDDKVLITCLTHGDFEQTAYHHLNGGSCPKCNANVSKAETIWLDSMNIKPEHRQYKILNYKVDGYDPDTNTVYEFYGDFWHGNPDIYNPEDINRVNGKTFGELYEATILREERIRNAGFNLVVKWG